MELNKTGGPANPTLNGGQVDENTFRFEGMTLFDYYVGQLLAAGATPLEAVRDAVKTMEFRNRHLLEPEKKD